MNHRQTWQPAWPALNSVTSSLVQPLLLEEHLASAQLLLSDRLRGN